MKQIAIYINLKNLDQVKWWGETGSKLVKTVRYNTIVDYATNDPVGVIFTIEGILKDYVVKKNLTFIDDPVMTVIKKRL
jgi:hypothetical protein